LPTNIKIIPNESTKDILHYNKNKFAGLRYEKDAGHSFDNTATKI
jgi:hypothetical protein